MDGDLESERMGAYTERVLVPMSLLVSMGYHVFLWHTFKHNPCRISLGIHYLQRKSWLQNTKQDEMLLRVQSLRNTKMVASLTASITILLYLSLAAATNNALMGRHLILMGSQDPRIFVLKYGSAALLLTVSFVCSCLGVGYLVDANFLMTNAADCDSGESDSESTRITREYVMLVVERGFLMATLGNRVMCVALPLLLWMFGPLPLAASSLALLSLLYLFDFPNAPPKPYGL